MRDSRTLTISLFVLTLALSLSGLAREGSAWSDDPNGYALSRTPAIPFSPDYHRSDRELAKGRFLVASRNMGDPRFAEAVILLIQYDSRGAMGLIINRPTEMALSRLLPETKLLKERKDVLYIGGPVGKGEIFLLLQSAHPPSEARHVFRDVYTGVSEALLRSMIERKGSGERFRVYAGYAGWGPRQLDGEVLRGDWHVLEADAETVFDRRSSEIWPELIRRSSIKWVKAISGPLFEFHP